MVPVMRTIAQMHRAACVNHCQSQNYCALDCITVGTHESNPTMDQCTDCKSFQLRK